MLARAIRRPLFDHPHRPATGLNRLALACALMLALLLSGCTPGGTRVAGLDSLDLRRLAERDLRNPQMLARGLAAQESANGETPSQPIDIDIAAHSLDDLSGFTVSMHAPQANGPTIHGAAIGRREGRDLRLILAVGDDMQVVRAALAQIHADAF